VPQIRPLVDTAHYKDLIKTYSSNSPWSHLLLGTGVATPGKLSGKLFTYLLTYLLT